MATSSVHGRSFLPLFLLWNLAQSCWSHTHNMRLRSAWRQRCFTDQAGILASGAVPFFLRLAPCRVRPCVSFLPRRCPLFLVVRKASEFVESERKSISTQKKYPSVKEKTHVNRGRERRLTAGSLSRTRPHVTRLGSRGVGLCLRSYVCVTRQHAC